MVLTYGVRRLSLEIGLSPWAAIVLKYISCGVTPVLVFCLLVTRVIDDVKTRYGDYPRAALNSWGWIYAAMLPMLALVLPLALRLTGLGRLLGTWSTKEGGDPKDSYAVPAPPQPEHAEANGVSLSPAPADGL